MTKAYAQMNSFCTAANGAGFAARAFALILILVGIALAVSNIICLDSLLALGLILVVIILGALDEPSMGLAPILVEQVFDIIRELHEAGTTILLVEQNAQMALSIADRAYVLETGKVSKTGPADQLLHDDDVRKAYLGN